MFSAALTKAVWRDGGMLPNHFRQGLLMVQPTASRNLGRSIIVHRNDRGDGYREDKKTRSISEGLKELKHEVRMWKDEVKERATNDPFQMVMPGHIEPLWLFEEDDCVSSWKVSADSDWGIGNSTASLVKSNLGYGLFSGNLETALPKDGKTARAGYCAISSKEARKSFKRDAYYDWSDYTHLILRIRGDGRTYRVNMQSVGYFDISWSDQWNYLLFTRGGPYWQVAKIPFSKFLLTAKGRIQDDQGPVPLGRISAFSITIADKVPGPFRLEVDYVGLQFDPTYKEKFAYEMYKVPKYTS